MGEYEDVLKVVREDDNIATLRFGIIHGEYTLNQLQAMLDYRQSPNNEETQDLVIKYYFSQLDAGLELMPASIALEVLRNPEKLESYLQYKEYGVDFPKRQEVLDLINQDQAQSPIEDLERTIYEASSIVAASRERIAELSS